VRQDAAVRVIVGVLIIIAWLVVPTWLTYEMGKQLGRRWYLVFGLVLSWLGVLIVVLLRRSQRGQLA
jgi:hypothetical protein